MSKHLLKNAIQALLTIICLLSSTLGLWAQETQAPATKERHIFTLGEIEVKDSSELNKNVTVDTINGEQIREFNANRLPNALDLIPGVTVTGGGRRNEKGIFVRGFSTSRVPVFLDGIPIYVPYDRTFDFDRFTTFDLSEIVVSKGFTSVLYGPNTMGGAINMVSRKPVKSFEGDVGAGYGSGDTYYGYTNVGTNQKKWYLEAGASDYNRDYYPMSNKFDPTSIQARGQRIESYSKDYKVNFKVGFTPAEGHEYALGYIQQHGEKGDPPDVRSASAGGDTKYWLWPRWDKTTTYLTTDTPIMDKSYVKVRLYYDQLVNWLEMFTNKDYSVYDTSFGARSLYDDWTIGGSIEAGTTLLPRNNIKTAFHYKRDTHNERNTVGSDNLPEPWQRSDDLISSWGMEDTIDITKSLYSIIGVSHDKAEGLRAREWDPKNVPGGWFDYAVGSTSSWNPQAGLFYLVSDTGKLHASVEKKTRFPSMKEKFSGGFGTKLPNPSLAPEKSVNYEIGYEDMFLKKVRFKTAVFHNDITNAIQSITVAPKITQNQNIGEVQQYGIEIEGVVSVTKDIEGGLNYTYLDRNNETPINQYSPTYIRLTSVPVHKIFSYVKYTTPLKGLSTLVSVEYLSDTGTTSDGIYNTGAFALVNMKASYIIREGLMVEAGVNNAFDRYYEYAVGYPEPGRTYFAGVRYSF